MAAGSKPMTAFRSHGLFYDNKAKDYRRVKQMADLFLLSASVYLFFDRAYLWSSHYFAVGPANSTLKYVSIIYLAWPQSHVWPRVNYTDVCARLNAKRNNKMPCSPRAQKEVKVDVAKKVRKGKEESVEQGTLFGCGHHLCVVVAIIYAWLCPSFMRGCGHHLCVVVTGNTNHW